MIWTLYPLIVLLVCCKNSKKRRQTTINFLVRVCQSTPNQSGKSNISYITQTAHTYLFHSTSRISNTELQSTNKLSYASTSMIQKYRRCKQHCRQRAIKITLSASKKMSSASLEPPIVFDNCS